MIRKWMVMIVVAAVLWGQASVADEGAATMAVAAEGSTVEAQVSRIGARAPYFLLFDGRGRFVEALANPHQDPRGAGRRVVEWLSSRGVQTIMAGEFGDNMISAMAEKGMTRRTATGTASDAVGKIIPRPSGSD